MNRFTTIILVGLLATALALALRPTSAVATPRQEPAITVSAVSTLHGNGWTVALSNGITLFVEIRVFDTGGRPPEVGTAISDFRDQSWFPILGYYGYATFTQHAIRYYARR